MHAHTSFSPQERRAEHPAEKRAEEEEESPFPFLQSLSTSIEMENATNASSASSTGFGGMDWLADAAWTAIFSAMIVAAIVGNAVVMWIVTGEAEKRKSASPERLFSLSAHRRMWNVTNSFIVNLSVADLLNSVFNSIFSFSFMKSK